MAKVLAIRISPDPVEGGSANDYDYANQDPCNTYDLDGRAAKTKRKRPPVKPRCSNFAKILGFAAMELPFGAAVGASHIMAGGFVAGGAAAVIGVATGGVVVVGSIVAIWAVTRWMRRGCPR